MGSAFKLLGFLVSASIMLGCSGGTADEHLSKARALIAAGKPKEASIELRNALQKDGDQVAARQLLGQVFLQMGDAAAAREELRKALARSEPGAEADKVVIQLAQALVAGGEWRQLISELGSRQLETARPRAELKTMLASALGMAGERDLALQALDDALAADPGYAPARLLKARRLAGEGQVQQAQAETQAVIDASPRDADAWVLRGELHSRLGNAAESESAWAKALELQPRHLGALLARVRQAMATGRAQAIQSALAALQKAHPGLPQTLDIQARAAIALQEPLRAREAALQLLNMAPNDPRVLTLAGEAEWLAGSRSTAQAHLLKALSLAPDDEPARLLLARTQVRSGQPNVALQTLDRLLKSKRPAAEAFGVAGEARMLLGEYPAAAAAFASAAAASPKDPRWAAAQAAAGLAHGDSARSLTRLQALSQSDQTGLAAMALVKVQMQRGQNADALKSLLELEARQRNINPMLPLARGQLHQRLGDSAKARAAFGEALKLDPQYLAASSALAGLDLAEGKAEAAVQRMRALAKSRPADAEVHLATARMLRQAGGAGAEVQAALETAVRVAPLDPEPALTLVAHLLQRGRPGVALDVARRAQNTFPDDGAVLQALAQAQLESGETQQAINSYRKLAAARQQAPLAMVALAQAHLAGGELADAQKVLQEALHKAPTLPAALRAQLDLFIKQAQWDEALALARRQQKREPGAARGWAWEATVHGARQNWPASAAAWEQAVARESDGSAAVRLHDALRSAGRRLEAARFAQQWLQRHPRDTHLRMALGNTALSDRDFTAAEAHYRAVLAVTPVHIGALNNLAHTLASQGKPGGVELAENANRLEPERPALLDTWALALAAEGKLGKALELQRQSVERYPREGTLRLTLARLALQSGDKSLARDQVALLRKQPSADVPAAELAELAKLVN